MLSRASTYLNSVQFPRVIVPQVPTGGLVTDGLFIQLDASLYGGSGNWIDNTGNNNNATLNGPTFIEGELSFFSFDGINDTMTITHTNNISLSTSQQRTMQMWVKIDSYPTSANRMIFFGKLSSNYVFDGYWGGVNSSGQMVIATNGTSRSITSTSSFSINLNTWYLLTFIAQISATVGSTKVYVNETEYISAQHGSDGYSESNNLTLGYLTPPLTGLGLISYLDGQVGAAYFYTRGLSAAEVSTNFQATRGNFGV